MPAGVSGCVKAARSRSWRTGGVKVSQTKVSTLKQQFPHGMHSRHMMSDVSIGGTTVSEWLSAHLAEFLSRLGWLEAIDRSRQRR